MAALELSLLTQPDLQTVLHSALVCSFSVSVTSLRFHPRLDLPLAALLASVLV
jgi:hypothetical protein